MMLARNFAVAAALCSLAIAACSKTAAPPTGTAAATQEATLERRIATAEALAQRLHAVRAVKRLQHAYGHYSEVGLWHDFADLFSDTAVGHYTQGDLGKEEIRKLFVEQVGQGILGLADGRIYPHIALSPVITLAPDGKSAKARWRIVAMLGGFGGNASFARGVYENAYAQEGGVWKVQEIFFSNQVGGRYGESLRPTVAAPLDSPSTPFHYEPDEVGRLVARPANDTPAATEPAPFATLAARVGALESSVETLTAENAVLNLQNAYGYYVDRKLWDDVADLFTDDGTMEIGQSGVYVGRAGVRRGLEQLGPAGLRDGEINDYIYMQPYVTVAGDGESAKARGVYLGMTGRAGVGAEWREGIYENEFVRENGTWQIAALRVYPRLVTDYDKGWALDAQPVDRPSTELPPDRPPSFAYESYPKFVIPPFHFRHPVTQRAPQYPASHAGGDPSVGENTRAPPSPPSTAEELETRLAALERELAAAAGAATAENLVNAFGYYSDEHMWDAATQLFAANGWAEPSGAERYVGAEQLRTALEAAYGGRRAGTFELNQLAQPVIHSAGGETRIRARLARIDAVEDGDDAYSAGVYEGVVVEEDGAWRIGALDLEPTWTASHSGGWARATIAGTTVPFHYANPVSGRPPAHAAFEP